MDEQYIAELKKLITDYDALLRDVAYFTYTDGRHGKTLRERREALMSRKIPDTAEKAVESTV